MERGLSRWVRSPFAFLPISRRFSINICCDLFTFIAWFDGSIIAESLRFLMDISCLFEWSEAFFERALSGFKPDLLRPADSLKSCEGSGDPPNSVDTIRSEG
jgi:hypothetical protein